MYFRGATKKIFVKAELKKRKISIGVWRKIWYNFWNYILFGWKIVVFVRKYPPAVSIFFFSISVGLIPLPPRRPDIFLLATFFRRIKSRLVKLELRNDGRAKTKPKCWNVQPFYLSFFCTRTVINKLSEAVFETFEFYIINST